VSIFHPITLCRLGRKVDKHNIIHLSINKVRITNRVYFFLHRKMNTNNYPLKNNNFKSIFVFLMCQSKTYIWLYYVIYVYTSSTYIHPLTILKCFKLFVTCPINTIFVKCIICDIFKVFIVQKKSCIGFCGLVYNLSSITIINLKLKSIITINTKLFQLRRL
jgi:hypothetical protein